MALPTVTPSQVRTALLLREEIALLDLRHEAAFATGHPLFATNMAAGRIQLEAAVRLPRKDVSIVLYDAGEGLVPFRTPEEAVEGAERIVRGYDRHCRAARALAETYFDSDKVLSQLLEEVGIAVPG